MRTLLVVALAVALCGCGGASGPPPSSDDLRHLDEQYCRSLGNPYGSDALAKCMREIR